MIKGNAKWLLEIDCVFRIELGEGSYGKYTVEVLKIIETIRGYELFAQQSVHSGFSPREFHSNVDEKLFAKLKRKT